MPGQQGVTTGKKGRIYREQYVRTQSESESRDKRSIGAMHGCEYMGKGSSRRPRSSAAWPQVVVRMGLTRARVAC